MKTPALMAVLVATDLSEASEAVVRNAAALALRAQAPLHVLHVIEGPSWVGEPSQGTEAARAVAKARASLDDQVARSASGAEVASSLVRFGAPHDCIAARRAETGAGLIVIGAHGGSRFRARVLGTTADRVLRETEVPCFVVRRAGTTWRRLAVPTDLSAPAERALRLALDWAPLLAGGRRSGVPDVTLLHVGWSVERESAPDWESRLKAALDQEARRVAGDSAVRAELLWAYEPTRTLIAWVARKRVDLLVVPTLGEGGWRRVLLGSTSSALARNAPCSVLLVPAGGTEPRSARAPRLERIVTGVDFSDSSELAAAWVARHLAPEAEQILVHAVESAPVQALPGEAQRAHAQRLHPALDAAAVRGGQLVHRLGPAAARLEVREGAAAAALAEVAAEADADLIVVGEHAPHQGVREVLGTTAERLVSAAPRPVLLARGAADSPPKRILAAVDRSPRSDAVLDWAVFLRHRFAAEITVCHVLDPTFLTRAELVSGMGAGRRFEDRYREQGEASLRERLSRRADRLGDAEVLLPIGSPGFEILAAQSRNGFDLVVTGSRGEGALARNVLGSVASTILRGATCPVLVVREVEAGAGWDMA